MSGVRRRRLVVRSLAAAVAVAALLAVGCGDCPPEPPQQQRTRRAAPTPEAQPGPSRLPPPDSLDRLVRAHHLYWVSGDWGAAVKELEAVALDHTAPRERRAQAGLRLAEIVEITGDRRRALGHLERVKAVVGPTHRLAQEADDRRARILTATPLADVRGPVPGSVTLRGEAPQVAARFRRAEQLLDSCHRVVVAPQLENVNEVLRAKRRSLAQAVAAYQKVASAAGAAGRAAALFRLGALHHHLAEALAFAIPTELLPSVARRLRYKLQGESTADLRRALSYYREVGKVPSSPETELWKRLAAREAKTLAAVLKSAGPRRGR